MRPLAPGGMPEVEVGIVITVLTVEAALQDTCAIFRERAGRGDITPAERDLLIDGVILLAMHVDDLAGEGRPTRPRAGRKRRGRNRPGGTNGTRSQQPPELTLCLGCGAVDAGGRGGARPSGVIVMPPDHARSGTGRMTPATECGGARAHTHAPESQLGADI